MGKPNNLTSANGVVDWAHDLWRHSDGEIAQDATRIASAMRTQQAIKNLDLYSLRAQFVGVSGDKAVDLMLDILDRAERGA